MAWPRSNVAKLSGWRPTARRPATDARLFVAATASSCQASKPASWLAGLPREPLLVSQFGPSHRRLCRWRHCLLPAKLAPPIATCRWVALWIVTKLASTSGDKLALGFYSNYLSRGWPGCANYRAHGVPIQRHKPAAWLAWLAAAAVAAVAAQRWRQTGAKVADRRPRLAKAVTIVVSTRQSGGAPTPAKCAKSNVISYQYVLLPPPLQLGQLEPLDRRPAGRPVDAIGRAAKSGSERIRSSVTGREWPSSCNLGVAREPES